MQISKLRVIVIFAVTIISFIALPAIAQQNARETFERARMLDESNQNLTEAIKLYGQVVSQSNEQRALAARAQYRIGVLYERLGRKAEAQKAFQAVVSHYADQSEVAQRARAKIPAAAVKNEKGRMKSIAATGPTATGISVRQVWAGPTVDYFGVPSADGRFLPVTDWTTGDLGIRDLATGETRRLTNKGSWMQSTEFALFPVLSPDGRQVAYAWLNKEGSWSLRVIGADGSAPRVLYQSPETDLAIPGGWTPDGKYIAAALMKKDRTSQAALLSLADGSLRVLKTSATMGGSVKGGLSPDGRYIVYDGPANPEAKQTDIFLLSVETGKEIPLVEHPADDLFPVWTPDGKAVLFASDRSGKLGLWLQRVVDAKPKGTPELVKADAGNIYPMGFTQKGAFYYGLDTGANDVYTATLNLQAGKVIDAPAPVSQRYVGSNSLPTWSPDGKYLAYVSRRGAFPAQLSNLGSRVMVIRSVETGQERDLPVDLGGITQHLWARDGRSFIATGQNKQGFGIFRIDAQTGALTTLVQEPGNNYRWPALSPDGKTLFYGGQSSNPARGWSIRALDLQSVGEGRVSTIAQEEGVNNVQPTLAPDGKTLFYLQNNTQKKTISIRARELRSGGERELFSIPSPPSNTPGIVPGVGGLSPDGQQLAFVVVDPQKDVLKVIPTTGGAARDICQLPKPAGSVTGTWMIWRPDGNSLLLVRGNPANPQDQTFELWQVSAAGGEPQKVGLAMERLGSLHLHPDGKHVAFAAGVSKPEVWVMENFLPPAKLVKTTASRR